MKLNECLGPHVARTTRSPPIDFLFMLLQQFNDLNLSSAATYLASQSSVTASTPISEQTIPNTHGVMCN